MDAKRIAILGSTGSIGVKALEVVRAHPNRYRVLGLAAGRNTGLLRKQIRDFKPIAVAVQDQDLVLELKRELGGDDSPLLLYGNEGYIKIATLEEVDTVISAITGAAGLLPTYEAIKAGKHIALANKETMVMAGPLVMSEAENRGVPILPIDSEHSAIFQALQGHPRADLNRVILTASGGPFVDMSLDEMKSVSPAQALDHPNWSMGAKISIDSATLMNKGLEAIEAKWLFKLEMHQIGILIHPQSIVHSMVEYKDGSILAQLAVPDMTIPISYALSFPRHLETSLPPLKLEEVGTLTFREPEMDKFRCLELALKAADTGDSMPAVLNGANEVAVAAFMEGRIGFLDIPKLIEKTMGAHDPHPINSIEAVIEADRWARKKAEKVLTR